MSVELSYDLGQATDPGKRDENEDSLDFFEPKDQGQKEEKGSLFVVADGMGGREAGAVASDRTVRKIIDEYYYGAPDLGVRESLARAIRVANGEVYRLARQKPDWAKMGTTVVVAALHGGQVHVANVGDSRAYLFRRGKAPRQLTVDHTQAAELVRRRQMTPEEAERAPQRHQLTRRLGKELDVAVELAPPEKLSADDAIVLCTDGLWDLVSSEEMGRLVAQEGAQTAAEKLVEMANRRGAQDNISVLVLKHLAEPAAEPQPPVTKRSVAPALLLGAGAVVVIAALAVAYVARRPAGLAPLPTPTAQPMTSVAPGGATELMLPSATATLPAGATATLLPTETLIPATATSTKVPPTPTRLPLPYEAPRLLEPVNGANISAATVQLRWAGPAQLGPGEEYDVWLWKLGMPAGSVGTTTLSELKRSGLESGWYQWRVQVVRVGEGFRPLSPWSQEFSFEYEQPPIRTQPPPTSAPAATETPPPRPTAEPTPINTPVPRPNQP